MSKSTVEDVKPEIIAALLDAAVLEHQFTDTGWKQLHRIVATIHGPFLFHASSVTIQGTWAGYDDPAILSIEEIVEACGLCTDDADLTRGEPTQGFIATTDYWDGQLPRIVRFSKNMSEQKWTEVSWEDVKPEDTLQFIEEEFSEANAAPVAAKLPIDNDPVNNNE